MSTPLARLLVLVLLVVFMLRVHSKQDWILVLVLQVMSSPVTRLLVGILSSSDYEYTLNRTWYLFLYSELLEHS